MNELLKNIIVLDFVSNSTKEDLGLTLNATKDLLDCNLLLQLIKYRSIVDSDVYLSLNSNGKSVSLEQYLILLKEESKNITESMTENI